MKKNNSCLPPIAAVPLGPDGYISPKDPNVLHISVGCSDCGKEDIDHWHCSECCDKKNDVLFTNNQRVGWKFSMHQVWIDAEWEIPK